MILGTSGKDKLPQVNTTSNIFTLWCEPRTGYKMFKGFTIHDSTHLEIPARCCWVMDSVCRDLLADNIPLLVCTELWPSHKAPDEKSNSFRYGPNFVRSWVGGFTPHFPVMIDCNSAKKCEPRRSYLYKTIRMVIFCSLNFENNVWQSVLSNSSDITCKVLRQLSLPNDISCQESIH